MAEPLVDRVVVATCDGIEHLFLQPRAAIEFLDLHPVPGTPPRVSAPLAEGDGAVVALSGLDGVLRVLVASGRVSEGEAALAARWLAERWAQRG